MVCVFIDCSIGIFHYDVDLSTYRMENDLSTGYEP